MRNRMTFLAITLALSACSGTTVDEPGDATAEASFLVDGRADAYGWQDGTALAAAVLDVCNTFTLVQLDDEVGLNRRAAENIVNARNSSPIGTLSELDAVSWVGPATFRQLVDYVQATGRVSTTVTLPSGFGSIEVVGAPASLPNAPGTGVVSIQGSTYAADAAVGDVTIVPEGRYYAWLGGHRRTAYLGDGTRASKPATRVEVVDTSNCGSDCTYHLLNPTGGLVAYDAPFGTGVDFFHTDTGDYQLQTFYRGGLVSSLPVPIVPLQTNSLSPAVGQSRLVFRPASASLPDCVSVDDRPRHDFTVTLVANGRSKPTLQADFDDVVRVVDSHGDVVAEVATDEELVLAPGVYVAVVNGTAARVDVAPSGLTEVQLERLEVLDSADSFTEQNGVGMYSFESVSSATTADNTPRVYAKPRIAATCEQGTGLDVLSPSGEIAIEVSWGVWTYPMRRASGALRFDPGFRNDTVRVGEAFGAAMPDWAPSPVPMYTVLGTLLAYDNQRFNVYYHPPHMVPDYRADDIRGVYVGEFALGTDFVAPGGWYTFVLNNSERRVRLNSQTHLPVGRIEVSPFYTDGAVRIRPERSADRSRYLFLESMPVGQGINVFGGEYDIDVTYDGGRTARLSVSVP